MVSWRAYMTSWVLYFTYYRRKRSTAEQIMEQVAIGWKTQYEAEAVPANIKAAESEIAVKEESFKGKGEAGQTWKVFHCSSPKGHSTEKVVIYWHGGAFIISSKAQHWATAHRLVRDHDLTVVFPQYTRIPESSAEGWCKNAIEFTLSVADDPRYKGKAIVHMGDSAGGWMSLRTRQLMCALVLGEETITGLDLNDGQLQQLKEMLGSGAPSIMVSPVVNFEIDDALLAMDSVDPWLGIEIFKLMRILWVKGPTGAPSIDFNLPANQHISAPQQPHNTNDEKLYANSRYSLNNGLDIFKRYHQKYPGSTPFRLLTLIGTADMCHVGCKAMQERLQALGKDVVDPQYIEEEGLIHVYAILTMPEADRAWVRIGEVLQG